MDGREEEEEDEEEVEVIGLSVVSPSSQVVAF